MSTFLAVTIVFFNIYKKLFYKKFTQESLRKNNRPAQLDTNKIPFSVNGVLSVLEIYLYCLSCKVNVLKFQTVFMYRYIK